MKNFLVAAAACTLVFTIISCGGGGHSSSSSSTTTTPPPPLGVTICLPADAKGNVACPSSESVAIGLSQQFNATFQNAPATVTWSINGVVGGNATVGTITTGGLYTAPSPFPSPNTFTLTATLQSDSSKTGNVSLKIVYPNNNAQLQTAPVQMGTTGGNATDVQPVTGGKVCCSGTLGALIQRGTPAVIYILSNNHVLAKSDKGTAGDNITQPGLVDNSCSPGVNVVAHLSEFAPLTPSSSPGPAPKNVDAAIGQIVAGTVVDTSGSILDLGVANGTSVAAAAPSALGNTAPSVGLQVAKVGRSTGLTCASISSVNTAVNVQYDGSCGGTVAFTSTFSNQIFIGDTSFSAPGDSGSLVVASASSRPVGLLFAGATGGGTIANPIADVIAAFTTAAGTPAIVGGSDHSVSCVPSATINSATITAGASNLSAAALQRAEAIRARNAPMLMQDPAVTSVEVGTSADAPGEAALVVRVKAIPSQPVPVTVEGMRTRVVLPAAAAQQARLSAADVERTTAVKEFYADQLMSERGIQGVGVSFSADNPLDPAVMIFTIAGEQHPPIPATLNGIRTRVLESGRFRAFGWGKETVPSMGSCSKTGNAQPKQDSGSLRHRLFTPTEATGAKKHGSKK